MERATSHRLAHQLGRGGGGDLCARGLPGQMGAERSKACLGSTGQPGIVSFECDDESTGGTVGSSAAPTMQWQFMKALGIAERRGFCSFVSHQICCSVLHREAEHELFPASVEEGVGNIIWRRLAGLLTGRYRRDAHAGSWARARQ